jgi:hypothetical protein
MSTASGNRDVDLPAMRWETAERRPLRGVIAFVFEHHPHRALAGSVARFAAAG